MTLIIKMFKHSNIIDEKILSTQKKFICKFCKKELSTKQSCNYHQERCKERKTVLFEEEKKETVKKVENDYIIQLEEYERKIKCKEEQIKLQDDNMKKLEEKCNEYKTLIDTNNLEEIYKLKFIHLSEIKDIKIELAIKDEQIKIKNEQLKNLEEKCNYYNKKYEYECNEYKKIIKDILIKYTK